MCTHRLKNVLTWLAVALLAAAVFLFGATPAAQARGGGGGAGGGGAGRGGRAGALGAGVSVYKQRIDPHWFDGNSRFWYRNDLKGGAREFILVVTDGDPARQPAFDHAKLAAALSKAANANYAADRLPFDAIEYVDGNKAVRFTVNGNSWKCDLATYACAASPGPTVTGMDPPSFFPDLNPPSLAKMPHQIDANLPVWNDDEAYAQSYFGEPQLVRPDPRINSGLEPTLDANLDQLLLARIEDVTFANSPALPAPAPGGGRGGGGFGGGRGRGGGGPVASPDQKFTAAIVNYNLVLRTADGKETALTTDGAADNYYTGLSWSRDSLGLVACRMSPAPILPVYEVESSPAGGGRTVLHQNPYALPGDKYTNYELSVFDIANLKQVKPDLGPIDMDPTGAPPGFPNLRWKSDGFHFTFEKYDRGHQRVRLIEVNAHNGTIRNIVDDKADGVTQKFIWSANRDGTPNLPMFRTLNDAETIYVSEMDGWRHMYLADARPAVPTLKQIDKGEWVLRGVDYVDADARQLWFSCAGVYPGQDRYFIHYGHVNFDGTNQVIMTVGDGTHSINYSPDYRFIIDTYGCVDQPPVHELRRVSDGKLVTLLEKAEVDGNWVHPELFRAKGRDGQTDIWGLISRPANFDPNRKYPIIENIYAGPQGTPSTMTPIAFGTGMQDQNLLNLGFITVKIDAMGSFGGSKAFHDVCWHNLKDGGFPDRIAWMKAAAAKYPAMDIGRVGIFGTSAGGQNAAAAVLFHGDFYKVAVANSGCHDNRMDKATWNEQWMGYPVGPWYAENSNIDNAWRLAGHLQLVVGELDTNVPPESTYRFADALIKARRDFEFVLVPGADHGAASPMTEAKKNDFLVRYLQGVEPANRNAQPGVPPSAAGGTGRGARGG